MKFNINEIYNETTTETFNGVKIDVNRCVINKDTIQDYLKNSIVKFIFFDEKYNDISSDKQIREMHKLKSKYPGNTYVRLPLVVTMDGKRIDISDTEENVDGYVLVSKRDFLVDNPKYKRDPRLRLEKCKQLCKECLEEFNAILSNNVFQMKEIDMTNEDENTNYYIVKKNTKTDRNIIEMI